MGREGLRDPLKRHDRLADAGFHATFDFRIKHTKRRDPSNEFRVTLNTGDKLKHLFGLIRQRYRFAVARHAALSGFV